MGNDGERSEGKGSLLVSPCAQMCTDHRHQRAAERRVFAASLRRLLDLLPEATEEKRRNGFGMSSLFFWNVMIEQILPTNFQSVIFKAALADLVQTS